jgi:His-Xaa-Ser system radical SAM maturase HxsB
MAELSGKRDPLFRSCDAYRDRAGRGYALLPFRLVSFDSCRYLLSNFVGEYILLPKATVRDLVGHKLPMHTEPYNELKSRHFLIDGDSTVAIDLVATKYRTKQSLLSNLTNLFMLVTTLRCDHNCVYCQVSHQPERAVGYDMTTEVADKAVEFIFRSPSPAIKVEFQGGESLLRFDTVKYVVHSVEEKNRQACRNVEFVITTNLSQLNDEMLDFCHEHDIFISTSLDGPRGLHNDNRPRPGHDSYEDVVTGIRRVRERLGPHKVSALMTTTRASLRQPKEIVDEYVKQGFSCIFLRPINPYGFAARADASRQYGMEEWLEFYEQAFAHILELNYTGLDFREEYSALILRKMLTPFPTAFVDLQSPAGTAIAGIVVNHDGAVYVSDEGRMLGEMGDFTFKLGSLLSDSYEEIMFSDRLLDMLKDTMTEGVPGCADCAFQPYCGSDPVRHYREQGDVVGFKPTSSFCRKNMGVMRHLIRLLEDDPDAGSVLRTWVG